MVVMPSMPTAEKLPETGPDTLDKRSVSSPTLPMDIFSHLVGLAGEEQISLRKATC